jgi:hypothetical protein
VPHYLDRVESVARLKSTLGENGSRRRAARGATVWRPNEYALSRGGELFFPCQPGRSSESHPSRDNVGARNPITFIAEANMTARATLDRPFSSCRRICNGMCV